MTQSDLNFIEGCLSKVRTIVSGRAVSSFDELIELDRIGQRNNLKPTNFGCDGCKVQLCQDILTLYENSK